MKDAASSVSIVIEWENAERIGTSRARLMIDELHRQLGDPLLASITRWELIFVYDGSGEATPEAIAAAVSAGGRSWPASLRFAPAPTGDYYEQKNFGVELASGEIILFLDSDVVPGPGWLSAILAPFADPKVEVVGGTTSVQVSGFYSGAMALGWFFPLPRAGTHPAPANAFCANNVAFRRDLIARHPFPATGQYRGQCGHLAATLRQNAHVIYMHPAAAVTHPPPEWFMPFAARALWAGYDINRARRLAGKGMFWRGTAGIARDLASSVGRILVDRRRVGFGPVRAAGATLVLLLYHTIATAAFLSSCVVPGKTRRAIERIGAGAVRAP